MPFENWMQLLHPAVARNHDQLHKKLETTWLT